MTKEKIDFIQINKKIAIFVALFTLPMINTFSDSHLIELFISFSIKCLNNEVHIYCVKQWILSKSIKMKTEKSQLAHFYFFVSSI